MKMKIPPEFYEDEELMETASPSGLSADAPPFHPFHEPVNIAIFNEGVPSMSFTSESDISQALHDIQDEAIDEGFPPDAEDAAELDAADDFVMEMVEMSLLEEREERCRREFVHVKKRWEARRANPHGHPRPAMNLIAPVNHNAKPRSKAIVPYGQMHRMLVQQDKLRTKEINVSRRVEPRRMKMTTMHQRLPIQQPLKQY